MIEEPPHVIRRKVITACRVPSSSQLTKRCLSIEIIPGAIAGDVYATNEETP